MRLRTAALTLACGLCVVGLVSGQEESTGNWFGRMFARSETKVAKEPEPIRTVVPASSSADRLAKAGAALSRRQDVCLALAKIAEERNDEILRQKVAQLEQRAWELYTSATKSIRPIVDRDRKDTVTRITSSKDKEGRR